MLCDEVQFALTTWVVLLHPLEEGSHLSMYDDQEIYYKGLIRFIQDVDQGKFPE